MPVTGDFRAILHQIKELREAFKVNETTAEAVNVLDGNLSLFGDELFQRLEAMERRLNLRIENAFKPLEEKIVSLDTKITEICAESYDSDASTPPRSKRRRVQRNPDLSHHVRSKILTLSLSWDTSKKITDPENQNVFKKLLREVSEVEELKRNDLCTERRIKDAITSTYKTAKKRDLRAERGDEEDYRRKQRKLQRLDRKLRRRVQSLTNEEKEGEKGKAVHSCFMSSEDSDDDQILTHPLPWRNEDLTTFFKELDDRHASSLNVSQRRMLAQRTEGPESQRNSNNVPETLKFWVES